jgi:hypothetical protein
MSAAITALSWELLARCRWRMALTAGCLVVLCVLCLVLPEPWRSEELGGWFVAAVGITLVTVLDSLVHLDERRLQDSGSLFPARLYTLPVPTVVLVIPPLLLGTLFLLGYWLAVVVCILRPCGLEAPLLWPGVMAAAVLACMQALFWSPFPMPWQRSVVSVVVLMGLYIGTLILADRGTPEAVLAGGALAILLAAYATAFTGVVRGRRGAGTGGVVQLGTVTVAAEQQTPLPFASTLIAQQWLEWRRMSGFFMVTVICVLISLAMMCLIDYVLGQLMSVGPVEELDDSIAGLRDALLVFGRSWYAISLLPAMPLLICASIGGSTLGKLTTGNNSPEPSAFLATRPIDVAGMVKAKLLTCVRYVGILWAGMFLMGLLWATCMGRLGEMADHLERWTGSAPTALLALFTGMILLPVISWLWLVSGMGVKVLRWTLLEVIPMSFSLGVPLLLVLLINGKLDLWSPILGVIVAVALVSKLIAVCWVIIRLQSERLVEVRTLAWAVAGWIALTGMLLAISVGVFAAGPLLAGFVVLMLPLARPLAAPLAVARHRTQ